mgnify:FL=1
MRKKKLSRFYKGDTCRVCKIPVTINCKTGFCKKHTHKGIWNLKRRKTHSVINKADNNPYWKGDKVSISGVHKWIAENWGKAINYMCYCGNRARDWATLNDIYDRNRENWSPMCRSCHIRYDYKRGNR